ncbi:MAG: metalloprotease [Solirubrobacteraceae bacterium]
MDGAPSPVPLAALFLAVGLVSTLVHELGHALAARSLVDTDVLIRIGDRVPLGTVRFGRVAVDLNAIATPRRAAGVAYADLSQATPRDMLLIALAGPAASLAQVPVIALCWVATGGLLHTAFAIVIAQGVFAGAFNLVPRRRRDATTGGSICSDGWHAREALRRIRAGSAPPARPPALAPHPLRGRNGVALGVEPLTRVQRADDLAGRAAQLAANASQSVPPPG